LQWLQDPSEINADNLNNIRRETSRHFSNKRREYMKDRMIKSRKMRWAGNVARMGETRNAYRILVGKTEKKEANRKTKM
jgi:hypothetical protein